MASAGVVPAVDPGGDVAAGLLAGAVAAPVEEFFLQGGEERLGGGVVQGAAGASHGLDDAEALTGFREGVRAILTGFNRSSQHRVVGGSVGVR